MILIMITLGLLIAGAMHFTVKFIKRNKCTKTIEEIKYNLSIEIIKNKDNEEMYDVQKAQQYIDHYIGLKSLKF